MTDWQNRIVGYGEVAPDQLMAHPLNWRIHPTAQQDALSGALDTVGQVAPCIVNRRTGRMLDGHLRTALALRTDQPTISVAYVDVSEEEETIILATLDPIGAMAVTDEAKYAELLADAHITDERLAALIAQMRNDGAWVPTPAPAHADDTMTAIPVRFVVHCRTVDQAEVRTELEAVTARYAEATVE